MVNTGDTLHAIAFRFHLDHKKLVRWNRIRNPDLIFVGQRLRLFAPQPSPRTTRAKSTAKADSSQPKKISSPVKPKSDATTSGPVKWRWPTQGKAIKSKAASGAQAIEIRGTKGQKVSAASGGSVVYSGSGLRGYGELIIIKHNETFLSAYAHNKTRLVEEGQRVKAGQKIAHMGDTESRDVMLHFEIRRNGETVDPLAYLPKR